MRVIFKFRTASRQFSETFFLYLVYLRPISGLKGVLNSIKAEIKMSVATAVPAPQKLIINENSMVKNDHSKPEKNWVELNPSFNVPHREYE